MSRFFLFIFLSLNMAFARCFIVNVGGSYQIRDSEDLNSIPALIEISKNYSQKFSCLHLEISEVDKDDFQSRVLTFLKRNLFSSKDSLHFNLPGHGGILLSYEEQSNLSQNAHYITLGPLELNGQSYITHEEYFAFMLKLFELYEGAHITTSSGTCFSGLSQEYARKVRLMESNFCAVNASSGDFKTKIPLLSDEELKDKTKAQKSLSHYFNMLGLGVWSQSSSAKNLASYFYLGAIFDPNNILNDSEITSIAYLKKINRQKSSAPRSSVNELLMGLSKREVNKYIHSLGFKKDYCKDKEDFFSFWKKTRNAKLIRLKSLAQNFLFLKDVYQIYKKYLENKPHKSLVNDLCLLNESDVWERRYKQSYAREVSLDEELFQQKVEQTFQILRTIENREEGVKYLKKSFSLYFPKDYIDFERYFDEKQLLFETLKHEQTFFESGFYTSDKLKAIEKEYKQKVSKIAPYLKIENDIDHILFFFENLEESKASLRHKQRLEQMFKCEGQSHF